MEDKQNIYKMFLKRCEDVCNAKFIISCNMINRLLQFMPNFSCIMQFIARCNQGENYRLLLDNASGGNIFKLPSSNKKIVALVTGLLFDIDQMNIDFNSFLIRYYFSEDYEDSYKAFCNSVIKPYAKAFGIMLEDDIDDKEEEKLSEGQIISDKAIQEQLFPLINSIREHVFSDSKLSNAKKDDLLNILEGFIYAFELQNAKMVKTIWLGIKYAFNGYKDISVHLESINNMLQLYDII